MEATHAEVLQRLANIEAGARWLTLAGAMRNALDSTQKDLGGPAETAGDIAQRLRVTA